MATYTIYLGELPIATTDGTEYAYAVWHKTKELAELIGVGAALVLDEPCEEIESYDPEELEYTEPDEDGEYADWEYEDDFDDYDRDYEPDVDECGFDPYEGCYTGDC